MYMNIECTSLLKLHVRKLNESRINRVYRWKWLWLIYILYVILIRYWHNKLRQADDRLLFKYNHWLIYCHILKYIITYKYT